MRRRRGVTGVGVAAIAAAVALTACGEQPPLPPDAAATPTTSATPSTSAPPKAEPRADEVLVEVNVSGGLAGVANQLLVYGDGRYTLRQGLTSPRRREGRMKPAELAQLRKALESPQYAAVPARVDGGVVHDGFQYVVSYDHRVVVAGDGARPKALDRVFAALPEGGPPTGT
ncbi:hypothetical protein ACGFMM_05035 [Streptomyces sp. NPDC048604]|uniref:hypothetical protein n=1 Tax=Streptomyces sp. NPDC048604 TaxID=3365578 RepID=UPI003717D275